MSNLEKSKSPVPNPLHHMQIRSWMISNASVLLQAIFYKSLIISRAAQKFMVLWRCIWGNACSMKMIYASWNSLWWLLTTNDFIRTCTNVKVILKFATILFSHFLLTKIILVQRVKLLILAKRIGWNVIFLSNGFTNAVLWFKIQQYISNPLQFSYEVWLKSFNLQFHTLFIIIYLYFFKITWSLF